MSVGSVRDYLLRICADARAIGADYICLCGMTAEKLGDVAAALGREPLVQVSADGIYIASAMQRLDGVLVNAMHSRPATAAEIEADAAQKARAA